MRTRIAVLASGGGSNLQALLDHFDRLGERRGGDVVVVASDRPTAGALARASGRGIATEVLRTSTGHEGRDLAGVLTAHRCDLVVLAGYLRLVDADVVRAFDGRIINVHPALLPAFGGPGMYGLRVHAAVLASGARVSGVTVHTIDDQYDRGKIIAQWPVPVFPSDDAPTLAARVLRVEHALLPRIVDAMASGRIRADGPLGAMPSDTSAFTLTESDDELARSIEHALA